MTSRDRTVVMILICVALAGAGWFLAIKPKRAEVARVTTEVEQAQAAADDAAAKVAVARAARSEYRTDYATVVRLGKAVPESDDTASLVYQLEATAEDTGVDFRSVTVAEGAAAPNASAADTTESGDDAAKLPGEVSEVPVTLTFDGGYFAMTRFLRKIDRYTLVRRDGDEIDVRGRLLAVNTVKLTPGSKGFPDVQAEVTVTAYRAPLPSVNGDDAAAAGAPGATPAAATDSGSAAPAAASSSTSPPASSPPAAPSNAAGGGDQ